MAEFTDQLGWLTWGQFRQRFNPWRVWVLHYINMKNTYPTTSKYLNDPHRKRASLLPKSHHRPVPPVLLFQPTHPSVRPGDGHRVECRPRPTCSARRKSTSANSPPGASRAEAFRAERRSGGDGPGRWRETPGVGSGVGSRSFFQRDRPKGGEFMNLAKSTETTWPLVVHNESCISAIWAVVFLSKVRISSRLLIGAGIGSNHCQCLPQKPEASPTTTHIRWNMNRCGGGHPPFGWFWSGVLLLQESLGYFRVAQQGEHVPRRRSIRPSSKKCRLRGSKCISLALSGA